MLIAADGTPHAHAHTLALRDEACTHTLALRDEACTHTLALRDARCIPHPCSADYFMYSWVTYRARHTLPKHKPCQAITICLHVHTNTDDISHCGSAGGSGVFGRSWVGLGCGGGVRNASKETNGVILEGRWGEHMESQLLQTIALYGLQLWLYFGAILGPLVVSHSPSDTPPSTLLSRYCQPVTKFPIP